MESFQVADTLLSKETSECEGNESEALVREDPCPARIVLDVTIISIFGEVIVHFPLSL